MVRCALRRATARPACLALHPSSPCGAPFVFLPLYRAVGAFQARIAPEVWLPNQAIRLEFPQCSYCRVIGVIEGDGRLIATPPAAAIFLLSATPRLIDSRMLDSPGILEISVETRREQTRGGTEHAQHHTAAYGSTTRAPRSRNFTLPLLLAACCRR